MLLEVNRVFGLYVIEHILKKILKILKACFNDAKCLIEIKDNLYEIKIELNY